MEDVDKGSSRLSIQMANGFNIHCIWFSVFVAEDNLVAIMCSFRDSSGAAVLKHLQLICCLLHDLVVMRFDVVPIHSD